MVTKVIIRIVVVERNLVDVPFAEAVGLPVDQFAGVADAGEGRVEKDLDQGQTLCHGQLGLRLPRGRRRQHELRGHDEADYRGRAGLRGSAAAEFEGGWSRKMDGLW